MSYLQLKRRLVKHIRKDRFCFGCGEKEPKGSEMVYTVGLNDGDFGCVYMCPCCDSFLNDKADDFYDGITEGEFRGYDTYKQYKLKFYGFSEEVLSTLQ